MLKRFIDITISLLALILLAPVFLILAVLIKSTSRGPVFYKGRRVGRGGEIFLMLKFRSKVVNADQIGTDLTPHGDPRVTKVGRFLRRTKVDEIPQIIDILRGKMSLVGPRPESPLYARYYDERQKHVLSVRPGMVGPAQIKYRHEDLMLKDREDPDAYYIRELMPRKLEIDLDYVENMSFLLDVGILFKSLLAVAMISRKENKHLTQENAS